MPAAPPLPVGCLLYERILFSLALSLLVCSCQDSEPPRRNAQHAPSPAARKDAARVPSASPVADALPTQRATLRESIAIFRQRIANGDAVASCQLARELDFCAGAEDHARYLQAAQAHRDRASAPQGRQDAGATLSELASLRGQYCAGESSSAVGERIALWRQAALRGHVSSMLHYGSGLAFGHDKTLSVLDELRTYRDEGPALVKRVARGGGFQANLMLARAYAPQLSGPNWTPLLRQAVAADAATSLAYYRLARELRPVDAESAPTELQLETEMTPVRWSLSPAQLAESERRYQSLRSQLAVRDKAAVNVEALNNVDVGQPVPGTRLCAEGGMMR